MTNLNERFIRIGAVIASPALLVLLASGATSTLAAEIPLTQPVQVNAANGKIDSPLTTVYGTVNVPSSTVPRTINVRAYGLLPPDPQNPKKTTPLLPGPTFVFQPGDLLRLRFHNYMNRANNPRLNRFENNIPSAGPGKADDIDEPVPHEINIPNNADITNLHVHGLHVDPKQDNVTLLILPEDDDPSTLVPELQRFVPTINRWWTRTYQYKIPEDHLPGTYWYHAHKHGATSTQVENGMAGSLLMLPNNDQDNIIPGLWNADPVLTHDRVLVLQEIADFGVRQGLGDGQGKLRQRLGATGQSTAPFTTINGQVRPTLKLPPGQLERWRFIIAGANHTTSSDIWVGKIVPNLPMSLQTQLTAITTAADAAAYTSGTSTFSAAATLACQAIPGKVKLTALDGITMWQSRDVTPATPAMGSAGNRLEMLIQPDMTAQGSGPYRVYRTIQSCWTIWPPPIRHCSEALRAPLRGFDSRHCPVARLRVGIRPSPSLINCPVMPCRPIRSIRIRSISGPTMRA
jgi:FtsP/CotA-like multicopper oxidase with cupredoxin domain